MKISELITELEAIKAKEGDLEVWSNELDDCEASHGEVGTYVGDDFDDKRAVVAFCRYW